MSTFTDQDLSDLADGLIAEIGARMNNPRELTGPQLISAAREVQKLLAARAAKPEKTDEENIDLFDLVERLPKTQRVKHLQAERVRLLERLTRVDNALGG